MNKSWLDTVMEYTDNAGLGELRQRLAKYYGFKSEELWIAHGAQGATTCAMIALLNPGDEVLVPNPGFLAYDKIVLMLHCKPVFYDLKKRGNTFDYDVKEITKKFTKKTKLIIVCSPNNPTASILSQEQYKELAAAAAKKQIWILSDEVYGELHYSDSYTPAARLAENIVSLNSFSKSHALTGWRIGWMAVQNETVIKKSVIANQYVNTCSSAPAQQLLLSLMKAPNNLFEKIRDGFRREYQEKCSLFYRNLGPKAVAGVEKPEAGFFIFLPLPKPFTNSEKFCADLFQKHNVMVMPGSIFGAKGNRFYRVSFAISDEQLVRAAKILSTYY